MTFLRGSWSWSADPCLWLMDRDPDPGSGSCYFCHWPSRCQQKTNFLTQFFLLVLLFEGTFTLFSKIKSQKESQNSRIQGFSYYYFCMMIEGSGSGSRAGSGSIPLTSGSGRQKNTWIRIRIRNTDFNIHFTKVLLPNVWKRPKTCTDIKTIDIWNAKPWHTWVRYPTIGDQLCQ